VNIVLNKDLPLPIRLNMNVPVDEQVPVNLAVDVKIPLNETELHQPFVNLRDLFEPYVRILDHLPEDWDQVPDFTIDALQGEGVNLVSPSEGSMNPWPPPTKETPPAESGAEEGGEQIPPGPGTPTLTITPFPTLTPSGLFPTLTPTPPAPGVDTLTQ
jgi:hypothetical protein